MILGPLETMVRVCNGSLGVRTPVLQTTLAAQLEMMAHALIEFPVAWIAMLQTGTPKRLSMMALVPVMFLDVQVLGRLTTTL